MSCAMLQLPESFDVVVYNYQALVRLLEMNDWAMLRLYYLFAFGCKKKVFLIHLVGSSVTS